MDVMDGSCSRILKHETIIPSFFGARHRFRRSLSTRVLIFPRSVHLSGNTSKLAAMCYCDSLGCHHTCSGPAYRCDAPICPSRKRLNEGMILNFSSGLGALMYHSNHVRFVVPMWPVQAFGMLEAVLRFVLSLKDSPQGW
jgi:hypothetical protein